MPLAPTIPTSTTPPSYQNTTLAGVAFVALSCSIGTGGYSTPSYIVDFINGRSAPALIRPEHEDTQVSQGTTVAEWLNFIRNTINPTIRDLSQAFHVTRQAIYDWLDNKPVSALNEAKVKHFADAVALLDKKNLKLPINIFHRPIMNGLNFFELVGQNKDPQELIRSLIKIVEIENSQRELLSARLALRKSEKD